MSETFTPDVVDVTVDLSTLATTVADFSIPLFIAPHNLYTDRVQSFSDLASLTSAGFAVGSAVYNFAKNCFNGKFAPNYIKVGRQSLTDYKADFNGFTQTGNNVTISLKVDSFTKTFTGVVGDTTATAIAAAFATAIEADANIGTLVTATASNGVLTVAPTASAKVSLGVQTGYAKLSNTSAETPTDAYNAIKLVDTNFFYVSSANHVAATQVTLGTTVSADHKIFVYSTQDANVKTKADTTNVFHLFKVANLDWVSGFYHEYADLEYAEGAVIGSTAAISLDSSGADSLHLKTLSGLATSSLDLTAREAIEYHNGNYAIQYHGSGSLFNGFMASGQFFDTMKFAAWLDARVTESVFGLMKRASDGGRSMTFSNNDLPRIKAAILANPVNIGIRNGSILEGYDPETGENFDPIINIPTRGEVPTNDIANRILKNVDVEVVYNQPLHYVAVQAHVILSRQ